MQAFPFFEHCFLYVFFCKQAQIIFVVSLKVHIFQGFFCITKLFFRSTDCNLKRTMAYKADSRMWVPRPREPQPAPKKMAKAKAKPAKPVKPVKSEKDGEKEPSLKRRKRRSAVKDENREVVNVKKEASDSDAKEEESHEVKASDPKAEEVKPRVADVPEEAKEKAKGVVLKRATDPAVKEKADALLGVKAPHSSVDRASEEAEVEKAVDDPYAKAPHGDSDDEEDLEAELRSLGELPPRRSSEMRSDRSDRAAFDEEERRSVPSSSIARPEKPKQKKKKKTEKASDVQSVMSEEPMKRKKKSWQGSKKLAKR